MASSGTINNTFRTGYAVRVTWTVTAQDIVNNTSTVTANVQLVSLGSSYNIVSSATKNGSLTVNGTKYDFTFNASLSGNQTKTIYTKTGIVVPHNSDGAKTCAFSCTAGIAVTLSGTYYGSVSASGSGVFNTIARASTISSVTASVDVNGTNAVTVNISRKASSFTHTVKFSIGSYSYTASSVGTSTSYAIPMTWLNAIPNATTGTATVTVTTYSGSTQIGSAVSSTFKITAPASVVPSVSNLALSEAVSGLSGQFKGYVQNKSKLTVSVTSSGVYSSTIKSIRTTISGKAYTGASFTSDILTSSGTVAVTTTVTDSRGRTASLTKNITVIAYAVPTISTFTVFRANGLGSADYEGTMVNARIKFAVSPVNNLNAKSYKIEYKIKTSTTWTVATSGNVYSYDNTMLLNVNLSPDYSYDIRLTLTDYFESVMATGTIPTAYTLLDFNSSGKGIAFGKVSEKADAMEVNMPIYAMNGIILGSTQLIETSAVTTTLGGTNYKKAIGDYEILPFVSSVKVGSGLTVVNNAVVIGQGVKKIRVSAQICYGAATAGQKVCAIWTNVSSAHIARTQMNVTNINLPESLVIAPCIYAVSEGNQITLRVYGTANDIIYGGLNQTYLTVEVVE